MDTVPPNMESSSKPDTKGYVEAYGRTDRTAATAYYVRKCGNNIRDFVRTNNTFRIFVYVSMILVLWTAWHTIPVSQSWVPKSKFEPPKLYQDLSNYFGHFEGFSQCNIRASNLYTLPPRNNNCGYDRNAFCSTRKKLLKAISEGGRHGFDAPYTPKGCHYRWYSVEEICMVLERFDGVVFVGDFALQTIYNGFNILLRQDLQLGALKVWEMDLNAREECRCDNQFIKQSCSQYFVRSSEEVVKYEQRLSSPYFCHRRVHGLLTIDKSPASVDIVNSFKQLIPPVPRSNYRPIPIIHSISPSTTSREVAAQSLLEFLNLADALKRKTPMLWVGPTAAGHFEIKNRKGNQEIWDFDRAMAKVAIDNDIDVLGMWNMSVQANSYDGLRYGEEVAIVQAMMVINWLSRLESS